VKLLPLPPLPLEELTLLGIVLSFEGLTLMLPLEVPLPLTSCSGLQISVGCSILALAFLPVVARLNSWLRYGSGFPKFDRIKITHQVLVVVM